MELKALRLFGIREKKRIITYLVGGASLRGKSRDAGPSKAPDRPGE